MSARRNSTCAQSHHLDLSLAGDTDYDDEIYHDKGTKPSIDHLESIEGVAVLHLDSRESVKSKKCSLSPTYQASPGHNDKDEAKHREENYWWRK